MNHCLYYSGTCVLHVAVINKRIYAYKLGHLAETALLSIKNEMHLTLARGEVTAVVLLDQSAAFDTIDHGTVID